MSSKLEIVLKHVGLTLLIAFAGWASLQAAAPLGYTALIWASSGIALCAILKAGRSAWPAIFFGSLLAFASNASELAATGSIAFDWIILIALSAGAMGQALVAAMLIKRFSSAPHYKLHQKNIASVLLIGGPLSSMITASVGIGALFAAGTIDADALIITWASIWFGNAMGVVLTLPLINVLLETARKNETDHSPKLSVYLPILLILMFPIAGTIAVWSSVNESVHQRNQLSFDRLIAENEKSLLNRISSYEQALLGGVGFFNSSENVSREEWRVYANSIDIRNQFPGITGIGYIANVSEDALDVFLAETRADDLPDFAVKPESDQPENFIIKYIEPIDVNLPAVGLNIAFESNRKEAAIHAMKTGLATITGRILLVQDEEKTPGFLLLEPLYAAGVPLENEEQRTAANIGWVYAPFVAKNFLNGLTLGQGRSINLRVHVYDANTPEHLIYDSHDFSENTHVESDHSQSALFSTTKTIDVMQRQWTLEWYSTPEFDATTIDHQPTFILATGAIITSSLGLLLILLFRRSAIVQRQVEVKTREIEDTKKHLQAVLDTVVDGIVSISMEGKIMAFNPSAERIFGYTADEVIGRNVKMLMPDPYHSEHDGYLHNYLTTGEKKVIGVGRTVEARRKDGSVFPMDLSVNRMSDANAKGFVGSIRDVTELEQAKKHLQAVLDTVVDGIVSISMEGKITAFNPSAERIFGYDADEVIGRNVKMLMPDPYHSEHDGYLHNYLTTGEKKVIGVGRTVEARRKDGSVFPMDLSVNRMSDANAKGFVGSIRDVTEREHAKKALEASEQTFRQTMEQASIGMTLISMSGKSIRNNKALCKLLGYTKREMQKLHSDDIVHPEDLGLDAELRQDLLDKKISSYHVEKRLLGKKRNVLWVQQSVSLVRKHDGTPDYFIKQIVDFTERKEMDRMKSEFISTVSHELRTPLTSIRGSLGLIVGAMANDIPDTVLNMISIAHNNSERLIMLVNDILDIDKLDSGQMNFEIITEKLAPLLESAVDANRAYAENLDILLSMDPVSPDIALNVDPFRLNQVLSNFLSNAAKFSEGGSEVRIVTEVKNGTVRIGVRDQGMGISEEFRNRIFTKFAQADSSTTRAKGGTGLGLLISKQLIEQMGGEIGFDSVVGEGTTFWFEFPLATEGGQIDSFQETVAFKKVAEN